MTPENVRRIQDDWAALAPTEQVAQRFYAHLFALDPSLRTLFASVTWEAQEAKFAATLSSLVAALDEAPEMVAMLGDLGRRHVTYSVLPSHYRTVGQALIATLEDALGPRFNREHRDAWRELLETVSATMLRAAR